jgi:hypothetical protein
MSYNPNFFIDRTRELGFLERLLKHERSKAIMRIRAEKPMGKSWLVSRMGSHCRESDCQMLAVEVDFRNPREIHEVQDTLSLVRLLRSRLDRPDYFVQLNAVINRFTAGQPGGLVSALNALAGRIEDAYDLGGLERLSQFLDVKWENVAGNTLYLKAYGLADQMRQQGRLPELLDRLRQERGHLDWSQGLEALGADAAEAAAPPTAEADRLTPLAADGSQGRSLAERRINEAFFACLAELARAEPVAFFFDGCEQAPDEAVAWIRFQLLDRLRSGELPTVVVVLAGRTPLDLSDLELDRLLVNVELEGFDQERVGEFLAAYGLQVAAEELSLLTRASGGVPGLLAQMVDNLRAQSDTEDPFFNG